MRLKAKLKRKTLNTKVLKNLKKLEVQLKAGHPKENPQTHEVDENGHSVLFKSHELNFTSKGYQPYLQIAYYQNRKKYAKLFKNLAKHPTAQTEKKLNAIGHEMVQDIKQTIKELQFSPVGTTTGRLYGAVSYVTRR